ncbi:MAG: EcsC family protein [Candidatus Nanopelagicales bacterium]
MAAQIIESSPGGEGSESVFLRLEQKLQQIVLDVVDHGAGPIVGSAAYGAARLDDEGDVDAAIDRIVRESVLTTGSAGFLTGLGGFLALPLTFPANVASNLVVNARMVGAIAHVRGHDLDDPRTQASILLTVAAADADKVLGELGVPIDEDGPHATISRLPVPVVREINRRASLFLVAKYGGKRLAFSMVRAIPVVGGLVGGGIDGALTQYDGSLAERTFEPV